MPSLQAKDFRLLMECIQEMYGNLDLGRFPETIFRSTARLIPSHICSYNEVSTPQHHAIATSDVPIDDNLFQTWVAHVGEHPLVRLVHNGRWERPTRTSDLIPQREFLDSAIYNEFYKFVDTDYQLHVPVGIHPDLLVSITYNRNTKDFSERERLFLEILQPHLYQSYRIAELVTRQSAGFFDENAPADGPAWGIIVLSPQGRLILMTAWARTKLEYFYGSLGSRPTELPAPIASWIARLLALRRDSPWTPAPKSLRSPERSGRCLRLVWVDRGPGESPLLMLREDRPEEPPAHLSEQLGVSAREAEVLFWVARGKTNDEIAEILRIRSNTVKTHLGHAYPKLGVSTRAGATAMVWQILSHRHHDW